MPSLVVLMFIWTRPFLRPLMLFYLGLCVRSSFLFSSGPGSPPHLGQPTEHEHDPELEYGDSSLIIPSLTLPLSLRRPTPYGQGVGEVRLLVLGRKGCGYGGASVV